MDPKRLAVLALVLPAMLACGARQPASPATAPVARMTGVVSPPAELFVSDTFSVRVIVDATGRPQMETFETTGLPFPSQVAAARAWVERASYTMPTKGGTAIAAPFQLRGRRSADAGAARADGELTERERTLARGMAATGATEYASMVPVSLPSGAALGDQPFSVSVIIGADARPKMETLVIEGTTTRDAEDAIRKWIETATYRVPTRNGVPVEAPLRARTRIGPDGQFSLGFSSTVSRGPLRRREGDLDAAARSLAAPKAAQLRIDIDTLRLRPGQRAGFDEAFRVMVLDSAGTTMGFLGSFSSQLRGDAAAIDGASVTGVRPGVASLRLIWPQAQWQGRSDPPLSVSLFVIVSASP